jgi:D-glycero-D-manno-heptose 1,7-bisphosphate phosphatase
VNRVDSSKKIKTAVFLDRDGVINRNIDGDYVRHWQEFEFIPSSREAIQRLLRENTPVIVVCNQACVGKGLVSDAAVQEINRRRVAKTSVADRRISTVYRCPHRVEDGCQCRKPEPGMLLEAAADWDLDLTRCYMVGDAISDIEAGSAVGCTTLLVKTGRGSRALLECQNWNTQPDFIVEDLAQAVEIILKQRK